MKTVKLLSGVECTFKPLIGKHQRILTENEGKNFKKNINEVLADSVTEIGGILNPDAKFFEDTILHYDKKSLLVAIRMHSLDDDPDFHFDYTYEEDGQKKVLSQDLQIVHDVEIEDEDGVKVITKMPGCPSKPYHKPWTTYAEIISDRFVFIELPKSKIKVRFDLLNGAGTKELDTKSKKQKSSHTMIELHHPVYFTKSSDKKDIPVSLDLDNLEWKDIEFLRGEIKRHEGSIDTEVMITHPVTDQPIIIDIIQQPTFFFPSGAI